MDKLGFLLNHIGKQVTTKVLSNAHITQTMKEIILENHSVDGGAAKNVSKGKSSPKEKNIGLSSNPGNSSASLKEVLRNTGRSVMRL